MKINKKARKNKQYTYICTNVLNFYLENKYGLKTTGGIPEDFQIENFIKFETYGSKSLTNSELNSIQHLIEGKELYDLTIKMFMEEISMSVRAGFGWMPTVDSAFTLVYKERKKHRTYAKAILKIIRKIKETSCYDVLMAYSGFGNDEKEKILQYYMK